MYLSYNWRGNVTSEINLKEFLKQEFDWSTNYTVVRCAVINHIRWQYITIDEHQPWMNYDNNGNEYLIIGTVVHSKYSNIRYQPLITGNVKTFLESQKWFLKVEITFPLQVGICCILPYSYQIMKRNNQIIKMNNQIFKITVAWIHPRLACINTNELDINWECILPNVFFSVWYFILKTTSEQLQLEIISYKHSSQNLTMIIISHLTYTYIWGYYWLMINVQSFANFECNSIWFKVTFQLWNTKTKCPFWFCHWINSKSLEIPHQAPGGQSKTN